MKKLMHYIKAALRYSSRAYINAMNLYGEAMSNGRGLVGA